MWIRKVRAIAYWALMAAWARGAEYPTAVIHNRVIEAKMFLLDRDRGFYRGTRFDWSGILFSLTFDGHNYYGPWFQKTDPTVHDFVYEGEDIVAGPCSAITGPVDEFGPVGYDEAKPGEFFVKIGIGVLRKPDDSKYDNYRLYDIVDPGKWIVSPEQDRVTFQQEVRKSDHGYGYEYRKVVRLVGAKPQMLLEHRLRNRGTTAIKTTVYNHNFLVLDGQAPGPGLVVTMPFAIRTPRPPNKELAEVRGNQIVYLQKLEGRQTVAMPIEGFGEKAADYAIRIENSRIGAGMSIRGDRPLAKEALWSIRTVVAVEPFVAIDLKPGEQFTWTTRYDFFALKGGK